MNRSFDPAPQDLATVVSPEWLTAMLAARWPGAVVGEVSVVELLATQATKVRLRLAVQGPEGVPVDLCKIGRAHV